MTNLSISLGIGRVHNDTDTHLLFMACSGKKAHTRSAALELYRGVMYQTYRAHLKPGAEPFVVILSALHGCIGSGSVIEPYDLRMDETRADELIQSLDTQLAAIVWPQSVSSVFLAGGSTYRRVMLEAVQRLRERRVVRSDTLIGATSGAIGLQRSQLKCYLRSLPSATACRLRLHEVDSSQVGCSAIGGVA